MGALMIPMTYPDSFEHKIGFDEIRTLLKGRCLSSLGTEWADNRLKMMTQRDEIVQALDRVVEMGRLLEAENGDCLELNIFDVRQALLRIRPERTYLEELELFDLKRALKTAGDFIAIVTATVDDDDDSQPDDSAAATPRYPALSRMVEGLSAFPDIVRAIDAVLNRYGKVKDTASPELLTIRHQLEQTSRGISHSLRTIIAEAQNEGYIDRDVTPTLRDGRLVIPVAPGVKRKIRGIVHDESASGKTVFIEPSAVVEANNRIRELKAAERREIIRILQTLTAEIRPHVSDMLAMQQLLGQVDFLRALSAFSQAMECVVPQISASPLIEWRSARHPLLELSLKKHGRAIVPLDITLPAGKRILLISGPNAGGKSVCLKTVGLLQYMLQCGMPVPLDEGSRMGVFQEIFIDIGDEQSLEDDLSTYSSHLLGMKQMMRRSGEKSLLLIDEFGGGTEPQIGGALAEAMLMEFVERGTMGVITTHYQNLKHYASESDTVVNGAMLYDRTQMQPLFMLQVGNPGSSFAIEIARKIGLPEEVIRRATEIVGKDYVMSDKYLLDIVRDKMYWENKRRHIHQREKQLEATMEGYKREMEDFRDERKKVMTRAKDEARELLRASNAQIENTIRSIKEAAAERERTREAREALENFKQTIDQNSQDEERLARKIEKIKRRQERQAQRRNGGTQTRPNAGSQAGQTNQAATAEDKKPGLFHVGDYVRLEGQTTVGRIQSIDDGKARVLFGMIHTTTALSRLVPAQKPAEDKTIKISTFVSKETRNAVYEKKLHFKPEIDLRGMRADEALTTVSLFIDDAVLLEQSRVRILHGTGTGALRELVRKYLATVPDVKRFHDERVQLGGAGITVVELA